MRRRVGRVVSVAMRSSSDVAGSGITLPVTTKRNPVSVESIQMASVGAPKSRHWKYDADPGISMLLLGIPPTPCIAPN